jgi:uncharacterized membrane protein YcjF (UPF0283 family)
MGERDSRDGLGQAWDRWVERVNAPDEPPDEPEDKEPWTVRRVLETAGFVAVAIAVIIAAEQFVDVNWGWIPWKSLALVALVLAALARWIAGAVRSLVRRLRGLPPPEREPTKRDRIAERLRDLDEPYLRRERSLTRD